MHTTKFFISGWCPYRKKRHLGRLYRTIHATAAAAATTTTTTTTTSILIIIITRKHGNCECIATWGRPTPRQSSSALVTTPCEVWSRLTYPLPYSAFLLLIHYFTLWPWPLTIDLEHLQCIACDVIKLCTIKFDRNRAIRIGVIAISIFDLITLLEHVLRVALGSGIISTKFDLRQLRA